MTELELLKLIKLRLCKIYQEDKHNLNLNLVASLDLNFQLNYTAVLGLCNFLSNCDPPPKIEGIDNLDEFGTRFECWNSKQYQELANFFQNLPDENIYKFFNLDSIGDDYFANHKAIDLAHFLSRYAPEITVDLSKEKLRTPITSLCKSSQYSFKYFPNCTLLRNSILKQNLITDFSDLSTQNLSDFYYIDSEQHKELFVLDLIKEPYRPLGVVSYFQPFISHQIGKINHHIINLLMLCLLHNSADFNIKQINKNNYVNDLNCPSCIAFISAIHKMGYTAAVAFEQAYDNYQKVGDEASLQALIDAQKQVNAVIQGFDEVPVYTTASFQNHTQESSSSFKDKGFEYFYINKRANSFFNREQSFNPYPLNLYLRDIAQFLLQELQAGTCNFDYALDQLQRLANTMPARLFYDAAVLTYNYDCLALQEQDPTKLIDYIVTTYKKRSSFFLSDTLNHEMPEPKEHFNYCLYLFKLLVTALNEQMVCTLAYDYQTQDKGLKDHQIPMDFKDEDIALIYKRYQTQYHNKLSELVMLSERLSALNADAALNESQTDSMYYYGFKWLSRALQTTLELIDEYLSHNNLLSRKKNSYHALCRGVIEIAAAMIQHYEDITDTFYLNVAIALQETLSNNIPHIFQEMSIWLHPIEKWQDLEFFSQHLSLLNKKLPNIYFFSEEHIDILCYKNYYQRHHNQELLNYAPIANPMLLEILNSYKEILCLDLISLFQQMINNLAFVTYSQTELKIKFKDLHSSFYFKANPTIKIFTFIGLKYQDYFNSIEAQLRHCEQEYSKLIKPIFSSSDYSALCSTFNNLLDAYEQTLNKVNQECLPTILPTDLLEDKFKHLKLLRFMIEVIHQDPYALFDYQLLTSNEQRKQFLEKSLGICNADEFQFSLDCNSNYQVYAFGNSSYLYHACELLFGPKMTAHMFLEPDPKSKITKEMLIGRFLTEFVENSKLNMSAKKSKSKGRNKKRR